MVVDYLARPRIISKCFDGEMNYGETDIDCGGPCEKKCELKDGCITDLDCLSGFCNQGKCTEPGCSDGIINQGEQDIDCGGPCTPCPTCFDGIINQGEEGIDCGGPCVECPPPCPSCLDGIRNQNETDIDCGGPCRRCCETKKCLSDDDCLSGFCYQGICTKPSCSDGILNQGEQELDCGGPCPACSIQTEIGIVGHIWHYKTSPLLTAAIVLMLIAVLCYRRGKKDGQKIGEQLLVDESVIDEILEERGLYD